MTISELIAELQTLQNEIGDVPVKALDEDSMYYESVTYVEDFHGGSDRFVSIEIR